MNAPLPVLATLPATVILVVEAAVIAEPVIVKLKKLFVPVPVNDLLAPLILNVEELPV